MTILDRPQISLPPFSEESVAGMPPGEARAGFRLRRMTVAHGTLVISALSLAVIVLGLLPLHRPISKVSRLTDRTSVMSTCVDKFSPQFKRQDMVGAEVGAAFNVCYSIISSSLLAEEQENRNGSYILQNSENVVLMWMVVVITISGVVLAGLQLLASYELAKIGKGKLTEGGSVGLRPDSVVVQSSVIGVVILTISFAFFMVFVVDVYRVEETKPAQTREAAAPSDVQGNVGQGVVEAKPGDRAGDPVGRKD